VGALVVLSLVPLYLAASAWWTWAGVEKLELSSVTAGSANATNYLVVGTDSREVQEQLGIGIDHYLEVDFAGFLSLVDALGTVSIDVPHPAFDPKSGLSLPVAGVNELDATQALAYVRSRTYTEIVDGVERRDPTADLGRVTRQQAFLAAVFRELGETRNPFTLLDALDGAAANVRVDDDLGIPTVLRLGLTIRGADPTTATLPTTRFFTDGGADVLLLDAAAAAPLLAEFA
jgi:LCP family protein required for cell wall assembly